MIYFGNAQGDITKIISEPIYQGSNNASDIVFIAPFSNVTVCVAFVLPNGFVSTLNIMNNEVDSNMSEINLQGCDLKNNNGTSYNAWRYLVDRSLTEYAGVVKVQFYVFAGSNTILSTYTATFNVLKGVRPVIPIAQDGDPFYDKLYGRITAIEQDIMTKENVTLPKLQTLMTTENAAKMVVIQPKSELVNIPGISINVVNMICDDFFIINAEGNIERTKQIIEGVLLHNAVIKIKSNSIAVSIHTLSMSSGSEIEQTSFNSIFNDTYFNFYIYK